MSKTVVQKLVQLMQATFLLGRLFQGFSANLLIFALTVSILKPLFAQEGSATPNSASVKITQPFDGQEFTPGRFIYIEAAASNPNGNIHKLEFYSGSKLLEEFWNLDPTKPMGVGFAWRDAPAGLHTIIVRAKEALVTVAESAPIQILVDPAARPTLYIDYHEFHFGPIPYADHSRGSFYISRHDRLHESLLVFFRLSGTATAGEDYVALPNYVVIPPGEINVEISTDGLDDALIEGDETLTLELIPPPPGTQTEHATNYMIGLSSATATIYDNESPTAPPHLEIITPHFLQLLQQGTDIEFKVIARDPEGYIPKVELIRLSGPRPYPVIGKSEMIFDTPPDAGTPITHIFDFTNAPPGSYSSIYLVGYDAAGTPITTNRTAFAVGANPDRVTLALSSYGRGTEASERLTDGLPAATSFYLRRSFGPTNQPVHYSLAIEGTAENGKDIQPINLSGVLAAGVGSTNIVITPISDDLAEGTETLIVKLLDPQCWTTNSANAATNPACYMVSTNSQIAFTIYDAPPTTLTVEAVDDEASEPSLNTPNDTAIFRVRRVSGPLEGEVRFGVEMSGEAWNGTDYQRLDGLIIMAANQSFVDIFIRPTADTNNEGTETVIFTLIDYNCGVPGSASALAAASATMPSCYDIAGPNSVQASIIDNWTGNQPPRATILYPPDGAVVEEGEQIVIEVHGFDHEGMLHSVGLLVDDSWVHSVYPAQPGTGTNMIYTGQVQFSFATRTTVGEHTLTPWAWDYVFLQAEATPVRVFVRAKDAPKLVFESPLTFEHVRTMADGTVRLKLRGGVGQVCRLETSSDLANWQSVSRLYLSNGQLDYIDHQRGTKRYFRLLEE